MSESALCLIETYTELGEVFISRFLSVLIVHESLIKLRMFVLSNGSACTCFSETTSREQYKCKLNV